MINPNIFLMNNVLSITIQIWNISDMFLIPNFKRILYDHLLLMHLTHNPKMYISALTDGSLLKNKNS